MRVLILLLLVLSCPCAEPSKAEVWHSRLASILHELRQAETGLVGNCAHEHVTVPAEVGVALAKQRSDGEAMIAKLDAGGIDEAALTAINQRLVHLQTLVGQIETEVIELGTDVQRYPHCRDAPEGKAHHAFRLSRISDGFAAIVAGGDLPKERWEASGQREHWLRLLVELVEAQRAAGEAFPTLAVDRPPLAGYLACCRTLHGRMMKIEATPSPPSAAATELEEARLFLWRQAMESWQELVLCEAKRRELDKAVPAPAEALRIASDAAATALQAELRRTAESAEAADVDFKQLEKQDEETDRRLDVLRAAWEIASRRTTQR